MLNMGGPSSLDGPEDGVETFLGRLFGDPEIIPLGPLQGFLVRHGAVTWPLLLGHGVRCRAR
jgi:protoheme ferro-lyase